jgi:sulfonate dioxygenase
VKDYEAKTGKVAKDRQIDIWKQQGIDVTALQNGSNGFQKKQGYND